MATYYKPQSPIQSGEDFIYPITTADQIMKSDNSRRLEQAGLIVADNSANLGGESPEYYATTHSVNSLKNDKLDKTATAADSAKLGGKLPAEYASAAVAAAHEASLGDAWTSGKTYSVGDYCISSNQLYKCKTEHTSGSAFNSDYWDAVSVATEIVAIRSETEHYGRYNSESRNTQNAVFTHVKIGNRVPALFVGNGNGTPIYGYCALFKNNDTECAITGTSGLAITCEDNGDGTAVVSISGVKSWGNYNLIVFYK